MKLRTEIEALVKLASSVRHCEIYKAKDGKWYLELAAREHGESHDADLYGPFDTEDALQKYLDGFSNPGGYGFDDSGTRSVPTKAPNGKKMINPKQSRWGKVEAELHVLTHDLKRIAAMSRGEDWESDNIRIHRYDRNITVWDLTNAGKRGKQVEKFSVELDRVPGPAEDLIEDLQKATSFQHALAAAKKFSEEHAEAKVYDGKERGVDVAPGGFKPIEITGKDVWIKANYTTFTVKDRSDINEETCIPAIKGGKADIKVFYRWVKDNQERIKSMDFDQVVKGMTEAGVSYHRYCALD